ncbi:MAG: hypothetical protein OJF59_002482 [Cytophagales bacterium]|nr:MAG: hypothetical protein OJF59_002482 [Cytophagales bacterium]
MVAIEKLKMMTINKDQLLNKIIKKAVIQVYIQ